MPALAKPPVIALITDMGHSDWFTGTMKGVVLSVCPNAQLVDICHGVQKQSVQEAAFMLRVSYSFFPPGTIFLCMVDPEVGTMRQAIVVRNERHYFITPNNGSLTYVQMESKEWEARAIENRELRLSSQSGTFHGRDIFAPAAGHLAAGRPFEEFGPPVQNIVMLPHIKEVTRRERSLSGCIIYIDSYGNLLTNVTRELIPDGVDHSRLRLKFRGHLVQGIAPHYAAVPINHPLMYWGSSGLLEIAINYGSAARKWQARINEWFELEW